MTASVATLERLGWDVLRDSRHRDAAAARDQADWLQHLKLGNRAARTLDSYERYTAELLRAFPDTAFADFTDGDLAHVLAQKPARSRHIVKACYNNWFGWGYKTRRIPGNPVDLLPSMRYKPDRIYDVFDAAEAEACCALPCPDGNLMTLLFWGGFRNAEARNLTGKRLDLENRQVLVIDGSKGGKTRRVKMINRVAVASAELLTLEGIGPNDFLWYDKPGGQRRHRRTQPISASSLDRWWRKQLEAAGVRYRNPHLARHTFATRLYELGLNDKEVAHWLGHEHSKTTIETYIHLNTADADLRLLEAVGDL